MSDIDINLKRNGNYLYFYDVINDQTSLALISALLEVDADLNGRYDHIYSDERIPIWIHIYSGGGQVFLSFAIIDQIQPQSCNAFCTGLRTLHATPLTKSWNANPLLPSVHRSRKMVISVPTVAPSNYNTCVMACPATGVPNSHLKIAKRRSALGNPTYYVLATNKTTNG